MAPFKIDFWSFIGLGQQRVAPDLSSTVVDTCHWRDATFKFRSSRCLEFVVSLTVGDEDELEEDDGTMTLLS